MLVDIVEGPIDEGAILTRMARPDHGAVLVFRGVVRNHHEGREVTHIDYHCYRRLAETELRGVAERALARPGLDALALVHRIGEVRVGEVSLLVAASGPHRRPVFAGVLDLVDDLKSRVPIWKKEYGPGGAHWVEGVLPDAP